MEKRRVYQSIPEFNQETHCVIEGEPVEHDDFLFIPLEVIELQNVEETVEMSNENVEPSVAGYNGTPIEERMMKYEQDQDDLIALLSELLEV